MWSGSGCVKREEIEWQFLKGHKAKCSCLTCVESSSACLISRWCSRRCSNVRQCSSRRLRSSEQSHGDAPGASSGRSAADARGPSTSSSSDRLASRAPEKTEAYGDERQKKL